LNVAFFFQEYLEIWSDIINCLFQAYKKSNFSFHNTCTEMSVFVYVMHKNILYMRLLQILFDIIYLFINRNEHYDCSKVT